MSFSATRLAASAALLVALGGAGRLALAAEWIRVEMPRATLVYEEGALTSQEASRFAGLLDKGIADVESYLRPSAPDGLREGPIVYRVGESLPYSMTRGRTVSLMLERVRSDSAPYLHETVHVLVPSPNHSVWLSEGFASYVESYVSENIGGYDARVFTKTGNRGVDTEATRWLSREAGRTVLPWVGSPGEPPEMLEERRRVAAPFYVLSQSFSKFLVEKVGLARVISLVSSRDPEAALARLSGRGVEDWKAEWLAGVEGWRATRR
jgi:hypothetical protein